MKRKPTSTRQQKIDWLLAHQSMWEGWSGVMDKRNLAIALEMKKTGLYSGKTYIGDIQFGLVGLISDARKQRREKFKRGLHAARR